MESGGSCVDSTVYYISLLSPLQINSYWMYSEFSRDEDTIFSSNFLQHDRNHRKMTLFYFATADRERSSKSVQFALSLPFKPT